MAADPSSSASTPQRGATRRERSVVHALLLAAAATTAYVGGRTYLVDHNTLQHNGRWVSGKVHLERGVIAAVATLTTRSAVEGQRLNLGVWHGFQEMLHVEELDLRELAFDLRVDPGSYVSVRLDDGEAMHGLRLSARDGTPSARFAGTVERAFTELEPLGDDALRAGWNRCRVERAADGRLRWLVNGRPVAESAGPAGALRWGFRGGYLPAYVDDVEARAPEAVVREDFANHRGEVRAYALSSAGAALACGLLALVLRRVRRRLDHAGLFLFLAASLAAFVPVATYAVLAPRPIRVRKIDFAGYERNIETEPEVLRRLARNAPGPKEPGVTRILFVGSSQTWGSGATEVEDAYPAVVGRELARLAGEGERFECLNTGIPGAKSGDLVAHYRDRWLAWRPDVTVIDLANNDRDVEAFRASLTELVRLGAASGARTVLVTEPNTDEVDRTFLEAKHAVVREVARAEGAALVDAQPTIDALAERGFLWWDHVHFTSFGHRLFGELLAPAVLRAAREVGR